MRKGLDGPDLGPAVAPAEQTDKDVKPMILPSASGKRVNMMYPVDMMYTVDGVQRHRRDDAGNATADAVDQRLQ